MREFTLVFPLKIRKEKKKLFYLTKIVFYDFVIIVINPKHKHEMKFSFFGGLYGKNDGVLIYSFQNHQRVPKHTISYVVTT